MKKYREFLEYIFIAVLFYFSNIGGRFFSFITFLILFFKIFLGDNVNNLKLLFFLLPNIRILDNSGFLNLINILLLSISMKYLFFDYDNSKLLIRKKFELNYFFAFLLIFIVDVSHVVINNSSLGSILFDTINISFNFLICIFLINRKISKKLYEEISKYLLLGVINSAIIYLFVNSNTLNMIFQSSYRLSGYGNDPNYLSVYIVLGICGILFSTYDKKNNIIDIVLILSVVFVSLLTSSKMCIISIIALFIYYVFQMLYRGNIKEIFNVTLRILPIVLLVLSLFNVQINYLFDKVISRFSAVDGNSFSSISTGRSDILISYYYAIKESLISVFFGRGMGYLSYYGDNYNITLVAHNTYFDFLLSWGLLGVTIFLLVFVRMIKPSLNIESRYSISGMPLFFLLIMMFSLSCMSSDMFWYMLAYAFIPLTISKKRCLS